MTTEQTPGELLAEMKALILEAGLLEVVSMISATMKKIREIESHPSTRTTITDETGRVYQLRPNETGGES